MDVIDDSQLVLSPPAYPLRTRRLFLRPLTVQDTDALLAYRSDVEVCGYLPFEPMTRADIGRHLALRWAGTWLTDEGQELRLGVELVSTGELIGDVVLFWRSRDHRSGEVGYVLHPGFHGHGYATEAARGVLGLGFDVLGLHRIVARIDERNEASARTARRLGMRKESRIALHEIFKGEWRTRLEFTMLADEWPSVMTDVQLEPMTEDQYKLWRAEAEAHYARSAAASGLPAQDAARNAADTYTRLLPDGFATPANHFWYAYDGDRRIGFLWLAVTGGTAIVHNIAVEPGLRRQGYGRAIMLAAERWCHHNALTRLGLHVFVHNIGARALYEQLGYTETGRNMAKNV